MRLQQKSDTAEQTPLYNTDSVRQILARASELEQQTQQDLLSPEQIEELGREIGLSPETVRRALGEQQSGNRKSHSVASAHVVRTPSPKSLWSICTPGVIYALVFGFLTFWSSVWASQSSYENVTSHSFIKRITILVLLMPFPLALIAGWRQYRRSKAIAGGIITMLLPLLTAFIGILLGSRHLFRPGTQEIAIALTVIVAGLVLSWIGNIARHQYEAWQAKRDLAKQR